MKWLLVPPLCHLPVSYHPLQKSSKVLREFFCLGVMGERASGL